MSGEHEHWRCVIESLQRAGLTISKIADRLGVEDRQVWRWKAGERVPRGTVAVQLHLLYAETCPTGHCRIGH